MQSILIMVPHDSSQILPNSPPTKLPALSLSSSVESKQTNRTNKNSKQIRIFKKIIKEKNTRSKHTHKHHINTKSETIIHKQSTRTFSVFLPEAQHLPSFLPAQNLEVRRVSMAAFPSWRVSLGTSFPSFIGIPGWIVLRSISFLWLVLHVWPCSVVYSPISLRHPDGSGLCELCCWDHLCARLYVDTCFRFSRARFWGGIPRTHVTL